MVTVLNGNGTDSAEWCWCWMVLSRAAWWWSCMVMSLTVMVLSSDSFNKKQSPHILEKWQKIFEDVNGNWFHHHSILFNITRRTASYMNNKERGWNNGRTHGIRCSLMREQQGVNEGPCTSVCVMSERWRKCGTREMSGQHNTFLINTTRWTIPYSFSSWHD